MQDLSQQEKVELIKKNILFSGTDILDNFDTREEVFKIMRISHAESGSIILKNGEEGDFIALILKGMVDIYVEERDGNELKIASVPEGSFVGEMAIIDNTVRNSTVKASTECWLGIIHSEDFWNFFQKNPVLAKNLVKGMNRRIKDVRANFIERLLREKEEAERFSKELERQVKEKTDQLREKDIKLLEMDRIAGIATLAAGVAHEINNPLSFVKSSISFVKKSVDKMAKTSKFWEDKPVPEPLLKEYKDFLAQLNYDYVIKSLDEKFERIKKGIDRIMKIVSNLKSFSRVDLAEIAKIDINQSIKEAVEVLKSQELENVEFVMNLQEVPLMETSPNEIHQCLLHTVQNAIDAVEKEGIINISSSYNKQDDQIIIKIIDSGKGMSPELLRQAMNPFFTTKPVGSGTGAGLSVTEKIVLRHGGKIDLSSIEGEGTTVTMVFPAISRMVTEKK